MRVVDVPAPRHTARVAGGFVPGAALLQLLPDGRAESQLLAELADLLRGGDAAARLREMIDVYRKGGNGCTC